MHTAVRPFEIGPSELLQHAISTKIDAVLFSVRRKEKEGLFVDS